MSLAALQTLPEIDQPVPYRARLVLFWIAWRIYDDGELIASLAYLATELRIPRSRLCDALAELRDAGLIVWDRGGGRKGDANRYRLPWFDPLRVSGQTGNSDSEEQAASVSGKTGNSAASVSGNSGHSECQEKPGRVFGNTKREYPGKPDSKDNTNIQDRNTIGRPSGDGAGETDGEPIDFEELKRVYPKRKGDQRWRRAMNACNARLREGYTWADIIDGAKRYSAYCDVEGKTGSEYVKQAATFCGSDLAFLESWKTNGRTRRPGNGESVWDRNMRAAAEASES